MVIFFWIALYNCQLASLFMCSLPFCWIKMINLNIEPVQKREFRPYTSALPCTAVWKNADVLFRHSRWPILHCRPVRPSLTERTKRHLNTDLQMMRSGFGAMCRVRDNFNLQLVVSGGAVRCYSGCRPVPQRTGCTHRLFSLISDAILYSLFPSQMLPCANKNVCAVIFKRTGALIS